ncbi:COG2863 Cytochrome c553 [Burkholderiaceae bacterium]
MRMLSVVRVVVLVGAVFAAAPAAYAQISAQRLALCAACHGADGNSQIKGIPSLAAQPKLFLETQLVLIREGVRDIPSMKGMLNGVSDAEVTALAKYYADKSLAPVPTDRDAEVFARGGKLAEGMRCGICHLPTYLGREQIPRLAGQREDYLLLSMQQFKNNQAIGRDSNMAASVYGVSDQDLQDISYFLARLTP